MPLCIKAAFPVDLHGYFSDEDGLRKNILGQAKQVILVFFFFYFETNNRSHINVMIVQCP